MSILSTTKRSEQPQIANLESVPNDVLLVIFEQTKLKSSKSFFSHLPAVNKRFNLLCHQLIETKFCHRFQQISYSAELIGKIIKKGETPLKQYHQIITLLEKGYFESPISCDLKVTKISLFLQKHPKLIPFGQKKIKEIPPQETPFSIHKLTDQLLAHLNASDALYAPLLKDWTSLLELGVDPNALSHSKKTPLLILCSYLSIVSSGKLLNLQDRMQRNERLFDLFNTLLRLGADPNLEGAPSTPLITLIMAIQGARNDEDIILAEKIIQQLLKAGASPDLIPTKSLYGMKDSPRVYAQNTYPRLLNLFYPKHYNS